MRFSYILLLLFFVLFFNAKQVQSQITSKAHIEYNEDGTLYRKGMVNSMGQFIGDWKVYYPSGKLRIEATYQNDTLHGVYKSYFKDGRVALEGRYLKGNKNGLWKYDRVDIGKEYSARTNFKNGIAEGKAYVFKNKKKFMTVKLIAGKITGNLEVVTPKNKKPIIIILDNEGVVIKVKVIDKEKTTYLDKNNLSKSEFAAAQKFFKSCYESIPKL